MLDQTRLCGIIVVAVELDASHLVAEIVTCYPILCGHVRKYSRSSYTPIRYNISRLGVARQSILRMAHAISRISHKAAGHRWMTLCVHRIVGARARYSMVGLL